MPEEKVMKVKAIQQGYFVDRIKREGEEFELSDESQFSWMWMEAIDWKPASKPPKFYQPTKVKDRPKHSDVREAVSLAQMQSAKNVI